MDTLFVGATRPAMKWGVTMDAIIVGVILASIILIGTGNPFSLLLYPPIHTFMYFLCLKDPRGIRLAFLALITKGKSTGRHFFGVSTASPGINRRVKFR